MARSRPLICEQLEGRLLRAAVGLPWTDPTHLTLSFAPDGTSIAGDSSDLFQTLDAQFPTPAAWQDVIVQAFQTWAAQTNISVGLVTDNGAPFGVAGLMQGDPRFGDIRIGARPMSPEVMAITVPPDPFLSGTLSGDMILNSSANLNPSDLFDVALHEAGLALGLSESTDPASVMYPVINPQATLAPGDIQNIQALYGTRAPDPNATTRSPPPPRSSNRHSTSGRRPWWPTATAPRSRIPTSSRCSRPSSTPGPSPSSSRPRGSASCSREVAGLRSELQVAGRGPVHQRLWGYRVGPTPERQSVRALLHRGEQPRAERLRDRSLRPVGHVRRPVAREPGQLAAHPQRAVRLPERGRHRRAARRRRQRALPERSRRHQQHVPDGRAALEPARLSGEQPVQVGGEPRRQLGRRDLSDPGTAGLRRADRRLDREPGRDAGQRGIARRLGLRCEHQSRAARRSCSTATATTSSRPPA